MSLSIYLSSLPPERRELFTVLVERAARLAWDRVDIQDFVFVPGRTHPTWDDSEDMFWGAVEQLILAGPAGNDELPILWIGYHVKDRFSKKREAQGFLLTDRRLIVKDSVDLVFAKGEARQYPLYTDASGIAGSAAEIASTAVESYDWENAGSLVDVEDVEWFSQLLVAAIDMTLETLDSTGNRVPTAPPATVDLRDRVSELGLGSAVKYADDKKQARHFAKFAKKMPLDAGEQILASFSDGTLAGVYGLMLTDRNVRSRDVGEDPVCTPREAIDADAVRVSPGSEHSIVVAPGQAHEVPTRMGADEVAALVTVIQEWADRRIN